MFILLLGLWLILNARFTFDIGFLEIVLFGAAVSGLITFFVFKFTKWDRTFERFFWRNLPRLALFGIELIWDILAANGQVIGVLLKGQKPEPEIVAFNISIENEMLRAMLANAITLTPGTITILCNERHYVVHCLKKGFIQGFEDGHLVRLARRMDESYRSIQGGEAQS